MLLRRGTNWQRERMTLTIKLGSYYEPGLYDFGLQVIKEHVRMASLALIRLTTSKTHAREISQSLAFVRGSDLDYMIAEIGEPIDPVQFRESFYTWCSKQRKQYLKSQPSSATITDTRS